MLVQEVKERNVSVALGFYFKVSFFHLSPDYKSVCLAWGTKRTMDVDDSMFWYSDEPSHKRKFCLREDNKLCEVSDTSRRMKESIEYLSKLSPVLFPPDKSLYLINDNKVLHRK